MLPTVLNKLLLARRLYLLARSQSETESPLQLSMACNLLQDAVETFLLGLSEYFNAGIGQRTDFDKYFDLLNEKLSPKELPFRQRLISLNRLRINSKHYGLAPAKSELQPLVQTAYEFFAETTKLSLEREFATLSLSEILTNREQRSHVHQAEKAFDSGYFETCLVECRKAIYVTFERQYDARHFLDSSGPLRGIAGFTSKVPQYARSKEYLVANVTCPTDYIIYNYAEHDVGLMKEGINPVVYWNVWRLTPAVYRESWDAPWVVKREFQKVEPDGIRDRAEYVLSAVTDLLITHQEHAERTRSTGYQRFYVTLKRDETPIYIRASTSSEVLMKSPVGLREVFSDYSTIGLDSDAVYWHLHHWEDGHRVDGYVQSDDVDV
jgi:hypothetical protein